MALTNETGSYILSNLPIGPYRLEAALPGFRTFVQTGIVLQVNGSPAVNPVLEVGQVTEQVEFPANAALVETPQCWRRPGRRECPDSGTASERTKRQRTDHALWSRCSRGSCKAAAGILPCRRRCFGRRRIIDRLELHPRRRQPQQFFENTYLSMPFPDAMQEFKVETSATVCRTASAFGFGKSGDEVGHERNSRRPV